MSNNEKEVSAAYDLAIAGLRSGDPIERYEELIRKNQEKERFEYCQGIKKAIERYREYKK